jgi:hypothetical protein
LLVVVNASLAITRNPARKFISRLIAIGALNSSKLIDFTTRNYPQSCPEINYSLREKQATQLLA